MQGINCLLINHLSQETGSVHSPQRTFSKSGPFPASWSKLPQLTQIHSLFAACWWEGPGSEMGFVRLTQGGPTSMATQRRSWDKDSIWRTALTFVDLDWIHSNRRHPQNLFTAAKYSGPVYHPKLKTGKIKAKNWHWHKQGQHFKAHKPLT